MRARRARAGDRRGPRGGLDAVPRRRQRRHHEHRRGRRPPAAGRHRRARAALAPRRRGVRRVLPADRARDRGGSPESSAPTRSCSTRTRASSSPTAPARFSCATATRCGARTRCPGDYMPDMQQDPDFADFNLLSPELSRGFRGLRVWLPLKMHGIGPFRRNLEEKLELARRACDRAARDPGHRDRRRAAALDRRVPPGAAGRSPASELDELNRELAAAASTDAGGVYLTGTLLRGRFARPHLRPVVPHPPRPDGAGAGGHRRRRRGAPGAESLTLGFFLDLESGHSKRGTHEEMAGDSRSGGDRRSGGRAARSGHERDDPASVSRQVARARRA